MFPESLLVEMLPPDRIAISRRLPWMNGTTVTLGGGGGVSAFCLGAFSCADAAHFKTVNIYSLSRGTWRAVCERLDRRIVAGQTGDYYESVFAEMVADGSLALEPVFFPAERWYEIDTLADLEAAEKAEEELARLERRKLCRKLQESDEHEADGEGDQGRTSSRS